LAILAAVPIYDDFSAKRFSAELWVARASAAFGSAECKLTGKIGGGLCTLRLKSSNTGGHAADTSPAPESIRLSTRSWEIGREPMSFFTTMAAEIKGSGLCACFGVLDEASGTVLGIASTGAELIAIARSDDDPLAPLSVGALEFTELGVGSAPRRRHDVRIEYDPTRAIARWYVDDVLRLYREVLFSPRSFACGLGLLPLRDLRGEPAKLSAYGEWGAVQYSTESELEPDTAYSAQPG
jgi:hypothetical protein